jgi:hypothetical protein
LKNDQTHATIAQQNGIFSFFGKILNLFYKPTKINEQWNNFFIATNYNSTHAKTIKLRGQGWNCLMGERERFHYKFQNCLICVIPPLKKMVIEDTRLARVCKNVSIALEENQRFMIYGRIYE